MLILLIHKSVKFPNVFTRQQVRLSLETFRFPIILDSRIRNIVSKGPKYTFPFHVDSNRCREKMASALNDFGNRWCKRESVECSALKEWKLSRFNIVDKRIQFYSHNTNLLPPKPKFSSRHLKQGIEEFHRKYVLVQLTRPQTTLLLFVVYTTLTL